MFLSRSQVPLTLYLEGQDPIMTAETHFTTGNPLKPPFPQGLKTALFGMGCFWGAERDFGNSAKGFM
jgi:peptide-methionine (S)-S-oxide reductase